MSTRLALTVVGTVVGAYFGYPQLGAVAGAALGSLVDPTTVQGPRINETRQQTAAEGMPRAIIFGTFPCSGNIIQTGPLRIIQTSESQGKGSTKVKGEKGLRTFAIGICEGEGTVLMVKQDNKVVYDIRAGSQMFAESMKWASNKVFYSGAEDQLPDPNLEVLDADTPAYRGTMYMVAVDEDVTKMSGAISQYEFLVARSVNSSIGAATVGPNNGSYVTDISVDGDGNLLMLENQSGTGSSPEFGVGYPGAFEINTYSKSDINNQLSSSSFANGGDLIDSLSDQRMGILAIDSSGHQLAGGGMGTNASYTRLLVNGTCTAHLADEAGNEIWNVNEAGNATPPQYGGGIFFHGGSVFMVTCRPTYTKLTKHSLGSSGLALPSAYINSMFGASGFLLHVSRAGVVRCLNTANYTQINEYNESLISIGTRTAPSIAATIYGFGVDDERGWLAMVYMTVGLVLTVNIYDLAGNLLALVPLGTASVTGNRDTKVLFTDDNIFIKRDHTVYSVDAPRTYTSNPVELSEIVDWLHRRTGFPMSKVDTSELTDLVNGLGLASAGYTAADAIDALRLAYNFDKSAHETSLYYPKRGKAVVKTITINDLTTLPESTRREQTAEIPYRLNARYRDIGSDYATLSQPAGSDSPDRRTTGEVTLDFALALTGDEAARIADIRYKTTLAEVDGEVELPLMLDVALDLAESDCVGYVTPDGQTMRLRIEQSEFADWAVKLTTKADRQSAYTSDVTAIPSPPPTLPPSNIVGDTELAIIDGAARTDSEDDISYLAAATGALPPWYGAELQRSLNGGADYYEVLDFETAAVMGVLLEDVSAASPYFTDTTNTLKVQFYRSTASIDSLTMGQFLSRQGVFALENADGSWEYMQGKDVELQIDETVHITTLHRGIANSGGTAHAAGLRFVWLADATYVPASSAWLNAALTHRAVSFSESEDDTTNDQTITYVGRSQQEWPPAYLRLSRDGSNVITATWVGRGRFGNAFHPVMSRNFTGYRITFNDGTTSVSFDTSAETYTYDASAMGPSVTVSVVAINRITGASPATSGTV